MKRFGKAPIILCVILALYIILTSEEFAAFLIIGRIPFTNITIPAIALLIVYVSFVPFVLLFGQPIRDATWRIIEHLGEFEQRQVEESSAPHYPAVVPSTTAYPASVPTALPPVPVAADPGDSSQQTVYYVTESMSRLVVIALLRARVKQELRKRRLTDGDKLTEETTTPAFQPDFVSVTS